MIHFVVHEEGDGVGVVVVEGIKAGQPRRCGRHPFRQPIDRDAPSGRGGPHHRQRHLQRRDAAPGAEKVALLQVLELRRGR